MTYSIKAGQRIQANGPEDMSLTQAHDGVRPIPDKSARKTNKAENYN